MDPGGMILIPSKPKKMSSDRSRSYTSYDMDKSEEESDE